jgi:hypothetical protein
MIDKIDGNKEKKFKSMNNRTFFLFPEAHNWLQSFIPLLKLLAEYCYTIPYMYSTVLWSLRRQEKLNITFGQTSAISRIRIVKRLDQGHLRPLYYINSRQTCLGRESNPGRLRRWKII